MAMTMRLEVWFEVPVIYLFLHLSILFLNVPNPGLQRTVLLFDAIDHAFVVIIFIPNYVLSSHVPFKIDIGGEDVVI